MDKRTTLYPRVKNLSIKLRLIEGESCGFLKRTNGRKRMVEYQAEDLAVEEVLIKVVRDKNVEDVMEEAIITSHQKNWVSPQQKIKKLLLVRIASGKE